MIFTFFFLVPKLRVRPRATDEFSYNIVENPVHVRDLHATLLQLLGFDHQHFTFKWQGLDAKLTGVEAAKVVKDLLA